MVPESLGTDGRSLPSEDSKSQLGLASGALKDPL